MFSNNGTYSLIRQNLNENLWKTSQASPLSKLTNVWELYHLKVKSCGQNKILLNDTRMETLSILEKESCVSAKEQLKVELISLQNLTCQSIILAYFQSKRFHFLTF